MIKKPAESEPCLEAVSKSLMKFYYFERFFGRELNVYAPASIDFLLVLSHKDLYFGYDERPYMESRKSSHNSTSKIANDCFVDNYMLSFNYIALWLIKSNL